MQNSINSALIFCCIALLCSPTLAQKAGYVNFGNIVALMPETQTADRQLEAFQNDLVAQGEAMASDFQQNYQAFSANARAGNLTPIELQKQELALQTQQQDILQFEQEVVQKIESRRQELLAPIVEKATKTIKAVAKENGYEIIFDTSVFNALLATDELLDIENLVRAKLGL